MVLPVWHKVTQADVAGYSPSLTGLLAGFISLIAVAIIGGVMSGIAQGWYQQVFAGP